MRFQGNEDLRADEAREKLELAEALGIPAENLSVTILPPVVSLAERRAARAVHRGEIFFCGGTTLVGQQHVAQ